jgi:putative membrane protein
MRRGLLLAGLVAVLAAGVGWSLFTTWAGLAEVGEGVLGALWTLPVMIGVHLVQLLLSSMSWRLLFSRPAPSLATCFRLRLIREGIDSLLPVARIGGEVVVVRMLTKQGVEAAQAGAGVIVDVSLEVLSQAMFLLAGVGALAMLAGGRSIEWVGALGLTAIAAGGFLLAQRFGLLRLVELLSDRIAGQFPDLATLSLRGLHTAAAGIYRRGRPVAAATALHFLSWSLGTIETWVVLYALGVPASLAQALVVESLGMAARTAGFAIPGALAVQEGGFALAALSAGLPESTGLSLSLVKRVREILVGVAGVALAWLGGGFRWTSERNLDLQPPV